MEKKTFEQLREQRLAANEKLGDLYIKAANREMTDEEKIQEMNLTRELKQLDEQMQLRNQESVHEKATAGMNQVDKNEQFREYLKDVRTGKADRELLLVSAANSGVSSPAGYVANSGAINLTIHEMIPTLHEGLGLPQNLRMVTGVTGNEVWPVSINDVEMEELGEVTALTDQTLDFAKINPVQRRVGLTVPVSNTAIDNAAFDLMSFVQSKFTIALRKYLATKLYSQAAFSGNKGPFSGLASSGNIDLSGNAYKSILKAIAEFSDKGFFEGDAVLIMDRETEAELMATPRLAGAAAGFVIENGLCAGHPYICSHYINTELNSAGKLTPTDDKYIGIGYWDWFALQQHGTVRLTVDATSQQVSKKNLTAITLNTAFSFTDLSIYINGGEPTTVDTVTTYPTQAFALYKVVDGTETETTVTETT